MTQPRFRFASHTFHSRFRSAFEPRKPRHRVLRFVLGIVGLGLLALLVMFSVALGAAMLAAGLVYRLWRSRGKPLGRKSDRRIVDAEYRVIGKPLLMR
jgi:UPF0716 family protein affecting phage T7 exclusion